MVWKNWISFMLIGILCAGCLETNLSENDRNTLDGLNAKIKIFEDGFQSGKLTSAEFFEGVKGIKEDLGKIEKASAAEIAMYGGAGGIAGRTGLHILRALAALLPGNIGIGLTGLLSMFLGGSGGGPGGGKKED